MFCRVFNLFITFLVSALIRSSLVFGNLENVFVKKTFNRPSLSKNIAILTRNAGLRVRPAEVNIKFKHVTCGSAVKLLNPYHRVRVHSHEVKYGSGSGQQSVTGVGAQDDINSLWIVKGKTGSPCKRGNPVKCGSTIRLVHQTTKRFLHSHLFQSPLSNNQEVSAFGESGVGDDGDHWSVICSSKYWNRDDNVRFRHTSTKKYLHISGETFGRPISGQSEVSAYPHIEPGNEWKAVEGVYILANSDK